MSTSYHVCHQCGEGYSIGDDGVAYHRDSWGRHDYDADADHTPYELEEDHE